MADDLIGQSLGQYEVRMVLGKGGMSTVYLGYQKSMDRVVAIKVLPREFMHDDTFLQRFHIESRTVARLEHINILPVYDVGEDRGVPYIVMRYLSGGTLGDLILDHLPDNAIVARILAQIGSALDYAHQRGVIHRDLKPSNVLLDPNGNAYLADFGIARMAQEASGLTGSRIIGTPAYIAPEMVRKGDTVTPSVDIYALGVLAYEMLTGDPPFDDEDPMKTLMNHVLEPVPSVRDIDPNIDPVLDAVVQKALAKTPEERYPTAGSFAAAFTAAVNGQPAPQISVPPDQRPTIPPDPVPALPLEPPPAPQLEATFDPAAPILDTDPHLEPAPREDPRPQAPPEPAHHLPAGSGRRRGGFPTWLFVPFVLLTLIAGVIVVAFALTDGDPGSLLAILTPVATRTPPPTVTVTPGGSVTDGTGEDQPTPRPDVLPPPSGGDRLAFTSNRSGQFDIYIMDIDGSNLRRLTEQDGPDFDPAWSPDGNRIVYASRPSRSDSSELWVMDANGENPVQLTRNEADDLDPDWSPSGEWIAFASNRTGRFQIYVMRPDGSDVQQLTSGDQDSLTPRWSADGKLIGYHAGVFNQSATTDLFIIDGTGGVPFRLTENEVADQWLDWASDSLNVAFTSGQDLPDGQRAVYILNLPSGQLTRITDGQPHDDDPAWSADGTRIAFDSDRQGNGVFDLYLVTVATRSVSRLTQDAGDNVAPAWQPQP